MSLGMLLYMGLTGCQKDETVGKDELNTTPPPSLAKGEDGPDKHEQRCQCEFQIVAASHQTPPAGFNDVSYQCFSKETCASNANNPPLNFIEGCDAIFGDPSAISVPYGPYPSTWYPFSCMPQLNTTLTPIIQLAYFVDYNAQMGYCDDADYNNLPLAGWTSIKVRCKDACNDNTWINSAPIYVEYYDNDPLEYISLEGCGCSPILRTNG